MEAIQDSVAASEAKTDRVSKNRTLYEAGAGEILLKNFLAGVGRGAGVIFVYVLFIFVFGWAFTQFFWPKLAPIFSSVTSLNKSLETMQGSELIPEKFFDQEQTY